MKKLTLKYVNRMPRHPEDLPPDVAEVYIRPSRNGVSITIMRDGFIVADHVMEAIESRIRELDVSDGRGGEALAERVDLYPVVSPEWRKFLEDLLRQDNSWSFFVPVADMHAVS